MATAAAEQSKTRSDLAQLAGTGPVSLFSMLAGVLVGYAAFTLLLGAAIAVLIRSGSELDLTEGWDTLGLRGGVLLGGLGFVAYLVAGYVAGRMGWRRGILHGLGVFLGSLLVVGAVALIVRGLAEPDDVGAASDALRSFGVPTTQEEWGNVGSAVGVLSLGGMLLGSLLGGFLGERWFTKVSRRAQTAEVDVRERLETTNRPSRSATVADLDELSKDELYELARELDLTGRSTMNKDELKDALASAMQLQS